MYGWLSTQAADYILRGVFHEFGHVWIAVVAYVVKPEWRCPWKHLAAQSESPSARKTWPRTWFSRRSITIHKNSPYSVRQWFAAAAKARSSLRVLGFSDLKLALIAPPMFSRLAGKCNTLTVCETRMKHEVRNQLARIQRSRGERCLKAIESRRFVAVKNFGDLAKFVGDTDKAWFVIQKYGNTDWASLSELDARLLSQAFFEVFLFINDVHL
ncbi:hypothetical protein SELMODRAFT_412531 [Selaginella moellendorffii]|uniref:Uncharacterized protein n=1 Tax=Selaginella moellendorffii TaxID=88036 RepID=D8RLS4_SELML|nr:hypothetical protein SELMODRAFT_412531 [Selaginella moellendorffii]